MQQIKVAVIGLGKMGIIHLNALRALQKGELENYYKGDSKEILSKIEICGLCDILPEKLNVMPDYKVYPDCSDLLKLSGPDLVIIATPVNTHFKISKQCLENGIHVFVEKPIVTKYNEWNELLKLSAENQLKIMAGHVERYNPVSLKLKQIIADCRPSKISFQFARIQPHDPRITDNIIVDKLVHDLDLSLFLFGNIKHYDVLDYGKPSGKVDHLRIRLEHENGSGTILVSRRTENRTCRELTLRADDKIMAGDFLHKTLTLNGNNIDCRVPQWIEAENNQVKDELVDFITHCFTAKTNIPKPLITINEISYSVKIIEEISEALGGSR